MQGNQLDFSGDSFAGAHVHYTAHSHTPEIRRLPASMSNEASGQRIRLTVRDDDHRWSSDAEPSLSEEIDLGIPLDIAKALCQAHKMEILGRMAGGLAHNFNNLLQGVFSALNLIHSRNHAGDSRELDFLIGHAFTSVKGVGTLAEHLLDFTRPRWPDVRAVDMNVIIVRMRDLLKCTILPGLNLKFELADGPMATLCDPHQLENTILDLVLNARDAMPDGGTLTLKTGHADLSVDHGHLTEGRYVSLCVHDSGSGMSATALERAFDPLYTTKANGHRVGLGLPLAEMFVKRFKGHISIESVGGQGTQVWLYLPISPV